VPAASERMAGVAKLA